jgi:GAF domain-containing protein
VASETANDEVTTVSSYLHEFALKTEDIEGFLKALTRLAVHDLSGPDDDLLVGITLLRRRKAGTVASSSERAQQMDEIQYAYDDGPCLTAAREQVAVNVPELREETRWPEYTERVLARGIRSIFAVPFRLESGDAAGLNLYSGEPGKFTAEIRRAAQDYADQASQALSLSVRLARHRDTEEDLKAALETRTTIALAVGIIMGQNRCSQDEAFALLRSASNTRNIKLHHLAAGIVASTGAVPPKSHFDQ